MRNPLAFLLPHRSADPRLVAELQAYVAKLLDVLSDNSKMHRGSLQADLDQLMAPRNLSAHLHNDARFGLHAVTFMARDYHAAMQCVILPQGVKLMSLAYNKRTETFSCIVDALEMLHSAKVEMFGDKG